MPYTDSCIIGNGFDRAHGMPTGYGDFKRWLIENNRFDVIHELQSAYPQQKEDDYLLWSDFENALGDYDFDTVINWNWENLYLTEVSLGNQLLGGGLIATQLPEIIDEAFTKWVRSIQMPTEKVYDNITKSLNLLHVLEKCVLLIAAAGVRNIFPGLHFLSSEHLFSQTIS